MVDIFKRLKQEAEEKKKKKDIGYASLFQKRKEKEKKDVVKAWDPTPGSIKTEPSKQEKKLTTSSPSQPSNKEKPVTTNEQTGKSMGRYYEIKKSALGVGITAKKTAVEIHCFAQNAEGRIHLFLASNTGKATKIKMETLEPEDFEKRFKPCSEHNCPYD